MSRFLSPVPAVLVLICCGALPATTLEQEKATEEPSFATPVLQQAEIVEVVPGTWTEIADRCQTEQPVEPPKSPGRLLVLRAGKTTYRIFLSDGRVIHCMDTDENDGQTAAPIDPGLQEIADTARNDLGQRLAVEPGEIQVLRAERVTWRDSSAGCPEADQMYMQVLTEGARIILGLSGAEYSYHQTTGGEPFLCESPSTIDPLPGPEIQ
ncbi:MAG: hypothetical protein WBO69_18610 [Thermoanaerobaculia bacterium]|jgi:hypothetical protein